MSLNELIACFMSLLSPASIRELASNLNCQVLQSGEPDRWARFDPAHYCRNLVAEGPHFQLLVIC